MTLVFRFCRILLIGFGIAVILSGAARTGGDPSNSSRDWIIQSVRTTFSARSEIGDLRNIVLNPELSAGFPARLSATKVEEASQLNR